MSSTHLMLYVTLMKVREGVTPIPLSSSSPHRGVDLTRTVKLMFLQYSFLLWWLSLTV